MGPRSGRKLEAPLVENDELLWVVHRLTNPSELGVGMLLSLYVCVWPLAGRLVVRIRYGEPPAGFSRSLTGRRLPEVSCLPTCWGAATPLFPERRCFLAGHLIIFATPLFPCSSRPVRIGTPARQIGQRTADDRPLIRQLIIFRTAVPVLSSAGSLLRPDSAGSLLFSWPRDLRNLHTRVSSSRKLPYASSETQQK